MPVNPFSFSNLCLLLISAGLMAYLVFVWRFIKQKTPSENFKLFQKPVTRFALGYAFFLLLVSGLAGKGFFLVVTMPPRFLLIFLPVLLIALVLSRAKMNDSLQALVAVPPAALILVQAFRILVEVLFLQFVKEKLIPAELSIHGRNYDLLIGLLALPVGYLFLTKNAMAKKAGILFNVLGLLSLINIFSIAIPSLPSSFRIYDTLYLPTYFPGVLILFLASMAVYLHILSLRQLLSVNTFQLSKKAKAGKRSPVHRQLV